MVEESQLGTADTLTDGTTVRHTASFFVVLGNAWGGEGGEKMERNIRGKRVKGSRG